MFCPTRCSSRYHSSVLLIKGIVDTVPGISQRDINYYDFLNELATRGQIVTAVTQFWQTNIKGKWESSGDCKSPFINM
jgi:D123